MPPHNPFPIFDGHNDTLLNLHLTGRCGGRNFFEQSERGHIDLPRAQIGGFGGGFFAVFAPDPAHEQFVKAHLIITEDGYEVLPYPAIDTDYARQITIEMIARLFRLERESQGQFRVARTADELEECLRMGVLAAVLHIEGAEAIDTGLDALEVFYQAGLRSLGIVWSRPNAFGHGVPFKFPALPATGPGLTEAGRELVRACNRLGVLLDLAHLNEQGFWDVAQISEAPLVVTHTAVHALCPSTRNLTDRQIDAIRASDGMIGLMFEAANLRSDGDNNPDTPIAVLLQHLDYLIERCGLDRVGFGSDYDGCTVLRPLADVSRLPYLLSALREHGFDDNAISKLTHKNWVRVLRKTWKT